MSNDLIEANYVVEWLEQEAHACEHSAKETAMDHPQAMQSLLGSRAAMLRRFSASVRKLTHRSQQEAAQEPVMRVEVRALGGGVHVRDYGDGLLRPLPVGVHALYTAAPSESAAPEGTASMTHEAISDALTNGAPLNHGQRAALLKLVSDDKQSQNDYDASIKDAERYRWLRAQPHSVWNQIGWNTWDDRPEVFPLRDAAIDATMAASGGESATGENHGS